MTVSIVVKCLGKTFANPLMNAAGVLCSTEEQLNEMAKSSAGAQITKSCTVSHRDGNPEPRYVMTPLGSINSMGLPNLGYDFYEKYAKERPVNNNSKPLFFSVSGLTLEESVSMARRLVPLARAGVVIMELNLSCPNVPGKPQIGYDLDDMDRYLSAVGEVFDGVSFGVKMPPYFDIAHFDSAAAVLNKHPYVSFITCINSVGNGLIIDVEAESVVIKPKDGYGGIGGQFVLPTALANVHAFYKRCPGKLVFGCGGVTNGSEVFMHLLAGASLVQIGTQLYEEGCGVFDRLNKELEVIMDKKGYKSIDEFRGKLKTIQ
eukprot:Tbor_TRINITY_DN4533_c0_g1::TRINITY_DN4533_c0_g1_i1::g.15895::m.15895/K00226/pyrD; dihydroorotate dehydrogenase (fumarate)